jgi:hypothetical protein
MPKPKVERLRLAGAAILDLDLASDVIRDVSA